MRKFVKKVIEKGGAYTALEASSKDEAMEIFKNENPSIVILDLNMSETTLDGMDVLTDIIKVNSKTDVLIVSAVGHQEVKDKCIELGAKSYIKKPIDTKILLKTLEACN
jgi:two-component system chemotaxis response regulator CheY